jgi:hypothetical protein
LLIILEVCSSLSTGIYLKTGLIKILRLRTLSLSSTNFPIETLQSIPHPYYGLLSGLLSDISKADYYSMHLSVKEAAEIVRNNRQLFEIIEKECESDTGRIDERLEEIETVVDSFIAKKDVWDRKDLLQELEVIARKKGRFVCLLGGKSTGKSLVLTNFSKQQEGKNRMVFYIDMRKYPGIVQGLVDVLSRSNIEIFKNIMELAEYNGYGIIKSNHFLIQQVRIPKTEK